MKTTQIAAQLYTVRDHCRTSPELAATAAKLRAIGYAAVQVSGIGPITENEIVAIMRGEGLTICATHEPSATILDEPDKVIDRLGRLGCNVTAYPYPHGFDLTDRGQIATLVRKLDVAGARLHAAGITLGYHNHAIEFVKVDGTPALEYIYQNTNPKYLVSELDTYWIHYGGGDVVDWCRRMRGRIPLIHLKDYGFTKDNHHTLCEIGAGTLPFKKIIEESEAGGCRWFIVEQDTCPGDPFASLKQSFDYMTQHLVEANSERPR
jgi:sugar phosphate isomerase/epimerase